MKENNKNPLPHRSDQQADKRTTRKPIAVDENDPQVTEHMLATKEFIGSYKAAPFGEDFAQNIMDKIQTKTSSDVHRLTPIYSLLGYKTMRHAAIILILFITGGALWFMPTTHSVPSGARATKTLSDGSTVLLNSGSEITYKRFWGRPERRVYLTGEAFFEVSHSNTPFIVETEQAEIRVLGTRFSVTSWPGSQDRNHTLVTLEEGKVVVSSKRTADETHTMRPNESLQIWEESNMIHATALSEEETELLLSWRQGGYAFQNALLFEVMDELGRRTNRTFIIPADLETVPVSYINPKPVSADIVLEDLSMALSFSYTENANGYELFATPRHTEQ